MTNWLELQALEQQRRDEVCALRWERAARRAASADRRAAAKRVASAAPSQGWALFRRRTA